MTQSQPQQTLPEIAVSATLRWQPARREDMATLADVNFDVMARDHPYVDGLCPFHWQPSGRADARTRFTQSFGMNETLRTFKLVESSAAGDRIVGLGNWVIKMPGMALPPLPERLEGDWWPSEEDRGFATWAFKGYLERRRKLLEKAGVKGALCCIEGIAIRPEAQRTGAGTRWCEYGLAIADELGVECTVEAAVSAWKFYERLGFEPKEHVRLEPPDKWKHKGTQEYIWMIRPARAKA